MQGGGGGGGGLWKAELVAEQAVVGARAGRGGRAGAGRGMEQDSPQGREVGREEGEPRCSSPSSLDAFLGPARASSYRPAPTAVPPPPPPHTHAAAAALNPPSVPVRPVPCPPLPPAGLQPRGPRERHACAPPGAAGRGGEDGTPVRGGEQHNRRGGAGQTHGEGAGAGGVVVCGCPLRHVVVLQCRRLRPVATVAVGTRHACCCDRALARHAKPHRQGMRTPLPPVPPRTHAPCALVSPPAGHGGDTRAARVRSRSEGVAYVRPVPHPP